MNIEIKYTVKLNEDLEVVLNEQQARELFNKLKSHFEPSTVYIGGGQTITTPHHPWIISYASSDNIYIPPKFGTVGLGEF